MKAVKFLLNVDVTWGDVLELLSDKKHEQYRLDLLVEDCENRDLNLSQLEKNMLYLEAVIRNIHCQKNYFEGLKLKTPSSYLTSDGYRLGSIVWYINCCVGGRAVMVFGKSPDAAILSTIQLYTGFRKFTNDDDWRKFLKSFLDAQEKKSDEWARYT